MNATVVVTTVGNEEQANTIARELVARRQAACVNIVPGLRSFYRWQGKLRRDTELLLLVKTVDGEVEAVCQTLRELHNYELPEILSFGVGFAEERFLAWLADSVDKSAGVGDDEEDDEAFAADED